MIRLLNRLDAESRRFRRCVHGPCKRQTLLCNTVVQIPNIRSGEQDARLSLGSNTRGDTASTPRMSLLPRSVARPSVQCCWRDSNRQMQWATSSPGAERPSSTASYRRKTLSILTWTPVQSPDRLRRTPHPDVCPLPARSTRRR